MHKRAVSTILALSIVFSLFSVSVAYDNPMIDTRAECTVTNVLDTGVSSGKQDVGEFVKRLYSICLGRQPDPNGYNDWTGRLNSSEITGAECAYGFIFSTEFQSLNVTDDKYVELMYNCFFGRGSDPAGKADWLSKMAGGLTRKQLFEGFANSVEFDDLCYTYGIARGTYSAISDSFTPTANRAKIEAFVTRLYSTCLGRNPDASGLADWTNRLASKTITGAEAAYGFFFSEEYRNKNRSNEDFVEDLYKCFLGRSSDEAGRTDWVNQLRTGCSDCTIFNGFSQSVEYNDICSSYGIVRGGQVSTTQSCRAQRSTTDNSIAPDNPNDQDFSITGYLYENSLGDSLYFITIKNNSKTTVTVNGNATALDKTKRPIGADSMEIDVLGPGETSIGYFYFDNVTGIDSVDYKMSYKTASYYKPVIANLSTKHTANGNNVTVSVTNNGVIDAQFVEAYALFFDASDNLLYYDSKYVGDNDSEIKPGATISAQLSTYGKAYDHVRVFYTGRSNGKSTPTTNLVSDGDFSVREYKYESLDSTIWFLIVTNHSQYDVSIKANSVAYDKSGKSVGAGSATIDVIGAGQTSICCFYYMDVVGIDHIDYQMFYDTNLYYSDVIHSLTVNSTPNRENVTVSITNNGSKPAEFVEAYALFFDSDHNVVSYDTAYFTDSDYELKSGATITEQLNAYDNYSTVSVYLVGRHYSG